MNRVVPSYILQQYEQNILQGQITGYILRFCTVATYNIKGVRLKQRRQVIDRMEATFTEAYERLLSLIRNAGGLLFQYEGNCLHALLPESTPVLIAALLARINHTIGAINSYASPHHGMPNVIRLAVGFGTLSWRIFENPLQFEYVFWSPQLDVLRENPGQPNQPYYSPQALNRLGWELDARPGKLAELPPFPQLPDTPERKRLGKQHGHHFIHSRFHRLNPVADVRHSVCCCLSLDEPPDGPLEPTIQALELLAVIYDAFLAAIYVRHKRLHAILLFDFPHNKVNKMQRACRLALEAATRHKARAACCTGYIFSMAAGKDLWKATFFPGEAITRAQKLLELARPGEALADHKLRNQQHNSFIFTPLKKEQAASGAAPRAYRLGMLPGQLLTGQPLCMIGREKETALLHSRIRDGLAASSPQAMVVHGTAGVGKSRLAREALRAFETPRRQVYLLACRQDSPLPLDIVSQLLRASLGLLEDEAPAQAVQRFREAWQKRTRGSSLGQDCEAALASLLNLSWDGSPWRGIAPEARLPRQRQAWLDYLRWLCAKSPVLIFIDDVQWLDPLSRQFLELLWQHGVRPLFLLATARTENNILPAELAHGKEGLESLALGSLNSSASRKLYLNLLGLPRLPREAFSAFHACAGGNPFNAEQLAAYLLENKLLSPHGEIAQEGLEAAAGGIDEVISRRIARLSKKVQESVRGASVLGFRFNVVLLSHMLEGNPIQQLGKAGGRKIWQDADELFYIFSHSLLQKAVYASIREKELKKLHLAAAEAMETVFEQALKEHSAEIARHFKAAGELKKAAHYYEMAADYFWDRMLLAKIEECMLLAAELSCQAWGGDSPEHIERLFHLALLYHYMHRMDDAEPLYLKVVEARTRQLGPRSPRLSPYLNNLGRFYKDTGRYEQAEKLLRRSLNIEKRPGPSSNVADRMNNLASLYSLMDRPDKAEEMLRAALEMMESLFPDGHWFTAVCAGNLGSVLLRQGRLEEAEPLLKQAIDGHTLHYGENHSQTAHYLFSLARLRARQGDTNTARELLTRVLSIWENTFGKDYPRCKNVREELDKLS